MGDIGKVVAAVSGGVDSAVACASLVEAGHEVIAVFMRMDAVDQPTRANVADVLADVRAITEVLGVELRVVDFSAEIREVVAYFVAEYAAGRTPNPCARCNRTVKFGKLLELAKEWGATYFATGHYARMIEREGQRRVARAAARGKDQSYVLFGVRREDLVSVIFPNGEWPSKAATRERARALALPVHDKGDSQEICFVPGDDYVRFVLGHQPRLARPGAIVDTSGKRVGTHAGVFRYTIGQRRGLGVAAGYPLYVVRLEPGTNTVVVGPREALARTELAADGANWHVDPPRGAMRVSAQIRYGHHAAPATVAPTDGDRLRVTFDQPQYAVTPGQVVVFYDHDVVMGGGWILDDE